MRPQQNRRMRGRSGGSNNSNNSNQNRRGPNPLTRNYESNGPDVKIRGSAQQIAEKYTTLARDAQSSGDRVMAENYLQHAEHYNRIIMAAQAQMPQPPVRDTRDDDEADGEADENLAPTQQDEQPRSETRQPEQADARENRRTEARNAPKERIEDQPKQRSDGTGPQPEIEGFPAELAQENPAPVKARTPRKRVAAKVEVAQPETPASEASQKEAPAVVGDAAPEATSDTKAAVVAEEIQPRVRRPRRPRIKVDEAEEAEASTAGDEIITEAAQ